MPVTRTRWGAWTWALYTVALDNSHAYGQRTAGIRAVSAYAEGRAHRVIIVPVGRDAGERDGRCLDEAQVRRLLVDLLHGHGNVLGKCAC